MTVRQRYDCGMTSAPAAIGLPGCKSSSQRALMLAALAGGEGRIQGLSDCRDSMELLAALQALGAEFVPDGLLGTDAGAVTVHGLQPSEMEDEEGSDGIPVGEGASTLRFLLALLAAGRSETVLRPAPALAARPHQELFDILRGFGAEIEAGEDARGPRLRVRGVGGFGARTVELPELRSSQTLSALWLAAGDAPITWQLAQPAGSRGYLDLTAEMLRRVRGDVLRELEEGVLWTQEPGYGERARLRVLADPSAVVFFAVAAMLLRRGIRLARAWNSRHADAALMRRFRSEDWLTWVPDESGVVLVPGPSVRRRELVVDLDEAPDSGPALAVLAAHLPHGARFTGLARLKSKESDRVTAMQRLAEACGGLVESGENSLSIRPGPSATRLGHPAAPRAQTVVTQGDHRTAMAVGIASLLHPGLAPDDRTCVAKSFPRFWDELARLQA